MNYILFEKFCSIKYWTSIKLQTFLRKMVTILERTITDFDIVICRLLTTCFNRQKQRSPELLLRKEMCNIPCFHSGWNFFNSIFEFKYLWVRIYICTFFVQSTFVYDIVRTPDCFYLRWATKAKIDYSFSYNMSLFRTAILGSRYGPQRYKPVPFFYHNIRQNYNVDFFLKTFSLSTHQFLIN